MRFQTRHYLQEIYDYIRVKNWIVLLRHQIDHGRAIFGVLLHEMMWCQRLQFPLLPIPYPLFFFTQLLKQKNALKSPGLFRGVRAVDDILKVVNDDLDAMRPHDVFTIASLLLRWLKDLPNPLIPIERLDKFVAAMREGTQFAFLNTLPQIHRMALLHIAGFLQDFVKNGADQGELAAIFGPLIIGAERANHDPSVQSALNKQATAFFDLVLGEAPTEVIYPLDPDYLMIPKAAVNKFVTARESES
jgi:hypothetical protein